MNVLDIFNNRVLGISLVAWFLAQVVKIPIEFVQTKKWNWALLLAAGGMPSSHSALITSIVVSIGLWTGFDSPLFALSFAMAMVIIYDATGIRRQAGIHASVINRMIEDLATGHPLKGEELREILGHTPIEAIGGVILGVVVALVGWLILR